MIVRLLFFILVFTIGWLIYRQITKALNAKSSTPTKTKQKNHEEAMVKCAVCGTFVPKSHAVYNHEQTAFCSIEHQQQNKP